MKLKYRTIISCIVFCVIIIVWSNSRFDYWDVAWSNHIIMMPWSRVSRNNMMDQWKWELLWRGYLFKDDSALLAVKNSNDAWWRVIMEHNTHWEWRVSIAHIKQFLQPQITLKWDNWLHVNYTHAKVFVRDNQAIFQTFNLTKSSFQNNREFGVVTHNPAIVWWLHDLFQADWNGRPLKASQITSWLVVCPQNCYKVIIWLLSWAQDSIEIYNQYISYQPILDLLEDTKVTKRIILPKTDQNITQWSWSDYVKLLEKPYVHAKIIVIDKKILLVSSINFSENSIRNNREIGVILTDSWVVTQMVKRFDQDWKQAEFVK